MKRRCPKCSEEWEIKGRIGFREECPECAVFIHTCANCLNYDPRSRGCRIPTTDPVHDREGVNFCEEFEFGVPSAAPAGIGAAGGAGATNALGMSTSAPAPKPTTPDEARRKFEGLFKDPTK